MLQNLHIKIKNKWEMHRHPAHISDFVNVILMSKAVYEGWNFNFGNIPLDWIQELLE